MIFLTYIASLPRRFEVRVNALDMDRVIRRCDFLSQLAFIVAATVLVGSVASGLILYALQAR